MIKQFVVELGAINLKNGAELNQAYLNLRKGEGRVWVVIDPDRDIATELVHTRKGIQRSQVVALIQKIHTARRNASLWTPEKGWRDNVISENARESFHAVLVKGEAGGDPGNFRTWTSSFDPFDSAGIWDLERSLEVGRSANKMCQLLGSLLSISKQISVVDPYLLSGNGTRYVPFLSALCTSAIRLVGCAQIDWHTKFDGNAFGISENALTSAISEIRDRPSIHVHRWEGDFDPGTGAATKLHPRYVFTDQGCISFDWGFQEDPKLNQDVTLHTPQKARALQQRFGIASPDPGLRLRETISI